MRDIIIAIDGYSACGKSTTARLVAEKLNYVFIDTGAMYRAVTLYLLENHISHTEIDLVAATLPNINIHFEYNYENNRPDTYLNQVCVEKEIRALRISECVSEVSAISAVRKAMVAQQQAMGVKKRVVMDGRDIGTHVFPKAELKIFMTADTDIRVQRRKLELDKKGYQNVSEEEILSNLMHRDYVDSHRIDSPLTKAEDAIELDTSHYTITQQVEWVYNIALEKINAPILNGVH